MEHGDGRAADASEHGVGGGGVEDDLGKAVLAAEVEGVVGHLVHQRPVLLARHAGAVEPVLLLKLGLRKRNKRSALLSFIPFGMVAFINYAQ